MYIEERKNGTYYLRVSCWDTTTKKTVSKPTYLGKNAHEAYKKLATLTDDKTLLNQLASVYDCDVIIDKIIKTLLDHKNTCDYDNINKALLNCIGIFQRFWAIRYNDNADKKECQQCRNHRNDYCKYFNQQIKTIETSFPCRAYQEHEKRSHSEC